MSINVLSSTFEFFSSHNSCANTPLFKKKSKTNLESREEGEYLPYRLGEEAVAFLEGHAEDEHPFFLALWHYTVHWPIEAPAELVQEYEAGGVQPGVKMPEYAAMTEALDQVFGRVLDALERTGWAEKRYGLGQHATDGRGRTRKAKWT